MDKFFQQKSFTPNAASDLQNDAELALHLVLYFLFTQDPEDGSWPGDDIRRRLRNTCHALEALHLFGLENSVGAMEAGMAWLVNLPNIYSHSDEEESIRLYPSRFKTLAWLEEFSDSQLRRDFEELEEYQAEDGSLRGITANQLLATMVYVDCLNHLERIEPLSVLSQEKRASALKYIEQNLRLWHRDFQRNSQRSHITNLGDISYAMDLLFEAGRLSRSDVVIQDISKALISEIKSPENLQGISSEMMYCAIQLATHFLGSPDVKEVVQSLLAYLRKKYEKADFNRDSIFLHPLVLRLLFAYHGQQLRAEITKLMLAHEQRNLAMWVQNAEQDLKDDFKELIKRRFEIEVSEIRPLTGGFTKAEVFRVHFLLQFTSIAAGSERSTYSFQPNPGSIVIKQGSLEAIRRSIKEYRNLPEAIQPYFARYVDEPQVLQADPQAPCYLIMEDLTYMMTFQDVIARIDQGRLSNIQSRDLEHACRAISNGLLTIHHQTKRDDSDFFGSQLSRLYISEIEGHLIRMSHPDKFPHLKSWFRGFWLGKRKYLSVEHYLRKIERHKGQLKVPYLMLIHGDCHSRNIMLDSQLQQLKLIDLDHLDNDGDYIKDFALLLEDVCVFRFVFDEGYRLYLGNGAQHFISYSTKPKLFENQIEYPIFSSEAVRLFQRHILKHLTAYAETINDESWKERLWLALATYLLFLVSKQKDKEYATMIYVEAIKLLEELVTHLDKGSPLSDIPFPGKHPAGVTPEEDKRGLSSPSWYHHNKVLARIHEGALKLSPAIRYEMHSFGQVVQYFSTSSTQPFVVIDNKKRPPALLLACPPAALQDPQNLAQVRETSSALQTILHISEDSEVAMLLRLIQQAFELNY